MPEFHDFEALRRKRNEAVQEMIDELARQMGEDPSEVVTTFDPDSCYCDCPDGPCEHTFDDWEDYEDGTGEAVCTRCGRGAIGHSMQIGA